VWFHPDFPFYGKKNFSCLIPNKDFIALSIADSHVTSAWGNLLMSATKKNEDSKLCKELHSGGRAMRFSGTAQEKFSSDMTSASFIQG
jgi:hypothetical protein